MLNHHLFVGIPDTAVVPGLGRREFSSDRLCDVLCCGLCVNEALEQRVAGHAVCPMQPRTRRLTDDIESGHIAGAILIDHHAAAGVVSCGDDGNPVAGDVDAKGEAALVSLGKVASNQVSGLMTDVEKDAVCAKPFHLKIDGSGYNIAWGQLLSVVEAGHKSLPIRKMQRRPFAAERLGHQK